MVAELLGDAQPETDNYTAQQRVGLRYDTAHSYLSSIGIGTHASRSLVFSNPITFLAKYCLISVFRYELV